MDYTEFPRELIYKEKASLKDDFGVSNEMTIEHRFYEGLLKRPSIKECFKKRETILRIFNNAYYLCTLILMDEDPRLTIDKYREIAENSERTIDWVNHFAPMTMALVYLKLKECRQECACELRIFDEFLLDPNLSLRAKGFLTMVLTNNITHGIEIKEHCTDSMDEIKDTLLELRINKYIRYNSELNILEANAVPYTKWNEEEKEL